MENMNNDSMDIEQTDTQAPAVTHHRTQKLGLVLLAVLVMLGTFWAGYSAGAKGYVYSPSNFKIVGKNDMPVTVDYSLLWEALDIVKQKYIDSGSIDQRKVLYGAVHGAVAAAGDDYTEFYDPEELAAFKKDMQGTFSGIGAEIGKRKAGIVIVAPLDGSPAAKAGLRPNDLILKINGQDTTGMTSDEVASLIRGPAGTEVKLLIGRNGQGAALEFKIIRQNIEVRSVKVEYKQQNGKNIAVIRIQKFGDDTKVMFGKAVREVTAKKVDGLVVDLRNNPGGYLDTSVEVASEWLESGKLIVKEVHSQKDTKEYRSFGYNRLGNLKTILLINGGSASAAEILAGALRDNNKATLLGDKSFGKGSVQELVSLGGNMAVKVTIAKWVTPSGKQLNKDGLVPDIEVKLKDEDILNGKDPQLDRALSEIVK